VSAAPIESPAPAAPASGEERAEIIRKLKEIRELLGRD
jgi:hypothetical protein